MSKNKIEIYAIGALLFLIGGGLQYFGLISPTQTNIIVLILMMSCILKQGMTGVVTKNLTLIVFFLYVLLSAFVNKSSLDSIIVYAYYFLCLLLTSALAPIIMRTIKYVTQDVIAKSFLAFAAIQVPVAVFQNIYGEKLGESASTNTHALDMVYGTLFFKSDGTMSAVIVLFMISIFAFNIKTLTKILSMVICLAVVYLGNSSAFHVVATFISIALIVQEVRGRFKISYIVFYAIAAALLLVLCGFFAEQFTSKIPEIIDKIYYGYDNRFYGESADRFAPLVGVLSGDAGFFGNGLLHYYDPRSKEWLYNSGLSTYYSLYYDAGLGAVALFVLHFIYKILTLKHEIHTKMLIALSFFVYCFFNFALTDLAYILLLNIILSFDFSSQNSNRKAPNIYGDKGK